MSKGQEPDGGPVKQSPRFLAVEILSRVEGGASYANILLQHNLGVLSEGRERSLATVLVNGCLKQRLTLDYALRQHLRKPMSSLPVRVRQILRTGAFQLLYLDKIPGAVAVSESVEVAKALEPKFSALVNGVLRRVMETGRDLPWPDAMREPVRYLSVRYSHPDWLVRRWWKRWGFAETEELLRLDNEPAPVWIRANLLRTGREGLRERLLSEGVAAEPGERVPESLRISGFGALAELAAFREGLFTVQDESSQMVAHVLRPESGDAVLDACSAPGGKTTHLAEFMRNTGSILAFDRHEGKLRLVEELAGRLGISIIHTCPGDARELNGVEDRSQDRVLVDAPCSGLGILRRKADLRWRKEEKDIEALPQLQLAILERAAAKVKRGGTLVYSTCTVEPEENFEVVKAFRSTHAEFVPADLAERLPFSLPDPRDRRQAEKGMLQLLPQRHGTDGFFLAQFTRREV
ncbi:ribosomal RNA small subunit methyltransferase B [Peptococcaceae bacterium CEB3]|nr:ribosomal RNA small subunit methyltransferase B [Peptococcaceae bacterium CEB3]